MPWNEWKDWLSFALSVMALVGFAVLCGCMVAVGWDAQPDPSRFPFNEPAQQLASLLAGAVGGIVATAFGQTLPPSLRRYEFAAVVPPPSRNWVVLGYAITYFLVVFVCVVAWVSGKVATLPSVANVALTGIGLGLAIVRAYVVVEPKPG